MQVITAPGKLKIKSFSIFLAGSIEQDKAERWQDKVIFELENSPITILNPRREKWNSEWEQSIQNKEFNKQVCWELDALELADLIVFYFDPMTKSPITLLELGLFAKSGKIKVCCPEGYWRKGNVDIVCERNGIPVFDDLPELIENLKKEFPFSSRHIPDKISAGSN